MYGPALLLLLAACGGSTGGNPNTFVPPVTRIEDDAITIVSADGRIDGDAAAIQNGATSDTIAEALTGAGVKVATDAAVNAFVKSGDKTGTYVLSSDVVARIARDYIDEFSRFAYGEAAAEAITTANKFTGPDGVSHADFGTFILSHAGADDYSRDYGAGRHVLSYHLAPSPVHVDLSLGGSRSQTNDGVWANSWSADDKINSAINHVIGTKFDDVLWGNSTKEQDGSYTDDPETFEGGPGADIINGFGGADTASYEHSKAPVDVDLNRQGTSGNDHRQRGGDAEGDRLTSIENLVGTAYADRLYGDDGPNVFTGLFGGDEIDGRGGTDTVSYARSRGPVDISLLSSTTSGFIGVQLGNGAANDRLKNIEVIEGSRYDDSFRGNGEANRFDGNAGDDTYHWSAGADVFDGGAGSDTADFSQATGALTVNLDGTTEVTAAIAGGDTDRLANVETIIGTKFDDDIRGDDNDNRLKAGRVMMRFGQRARVKIF